MLLIISSCLLVASFSNSLLAQTQTTTELKQEVQQNSSQVDTNTILTGGSLAGLLLTTAKQFLDQRKNKKEDRGTDIDLTRAIAIIGKIFAYAYVIDPHWKIILDKPKDSNPLNANITIGHEYSQEMQSLIDYTKTVIQAPVPNMNIPIPPVDPKTAALNNPPKPPDSSA